MSWGALQSYIHEKLFPTVMTVRRITQVTEKPATLSTNVVKLCNFQKKRKKDIAYI